MSASGVLSAVCEAGFQGFSCGFGPGRGPHDALDALAAGICEKKVNWVPGAGIRGFFTSLDQGWLERVPRAPDRGQAGPAPGRQVAGRRGHRERDMAKDPAGLAAGAPVSPLLANVCLGYVLDLRAGWHRRRHARGDMIIVRFAGDVIAGSGHLGDARQFLRDLRGRFARFALELHPGRTRLIESGRSAAARPAAPGRREAGDVRCPRLHAHLREDAGGTFPRSGGSLSPSDAGEAESGQRPAQAAPARARPGAEAVAGQRGARPHGLPRGARQHPGRPGLPDTG